mmetsp:Transcript_116038/g.333242  ORF Transcript_116038/g.333242 Transcript_116038/m.333242 type:complete len:200 (+) Transcript_116038:1089-1688(+)
MTARTHSPAAGCCIECCGSRDRVGPKCNRSSSKLCSSSCRCGSRGQLGGGFSGACAKGSLKGTAIGEGMYGALAPAATGASKGRCRISRACASEVASAKRGGAGSFTCEASPARARAFSTRAAVRSAYSCCCSWLAVRRGCGCGARPSMGAGAGGRAGGSGGCDAELPSVAAASPASRTWRASAAWRRPGLFWGTAAAS